MHIKFNDPNFSPEETKSIISVIGKAIKLSKFYGRVEILRGKKDSLYGEGEGAAITKFFPFVMPKMTLFDAAFQSEDFLGITITHELIHCRQGGLRVAWENLLWVFLEEFGLDQREIPIEEEAAEAVNMWWDTNQGMV